MIPIATVMTNQGNKRIWCELSLTASQSAKAGLNLHYPMHALDCLFWCVWDHVNATSARLDLKYLNSGPDSAVLYCQKSMCVAMPTFGKIFSCGSCCVPRYHMIAPDSKMDRSPR